MWDWHHLYFTAHMSGLGNPLCISTAWGSRKCIFQMWFRRILCMILSARSLGRCGSSRLIFTFDSQHNSYYFWGLAHFFACLLAGLLTSSLAHFLHLLAVGQSIFIWQWRRFLCGQCSDIVAWFLDGSHWHFWKVQSASDVGFMKRTSWSMMTDLMSGSSAPLNSLLNLMADISISTKMSSMPHLCVPVAVVHNSVRQTFFLGLCTGFVFLSLFLSLLCFACSSFLSELWLPVLLLHTEAGISYRIICLCLLLWWIQTDLQEKRHIIDVCVLQGCMKVKMKTCMIHLM